MTPLIAIYPNARQRGVGVHNNARTYDWRAPACSPANNQRVLALGHVSNLDEGLLAKHGTDAHFVQYVLHDANGAPVTSQPRINKGGLPWIESLGYAVRASIMALDIDNPGHANWTADALEKFQNVTRKLPIFQGAVMYFTAHGYRLIRALNEWIPIDTFESRLDAFMIEAETQGLNPDPLCRDWTRHFRCPWVARADGADQKQVPDFDEMVLFDPPQVGHSKKRKIPKAKRDMEKAVPIIFEKAIEAIGSEWTGRAKLIAYAVAVVTTEWHTLFLAIAGTLCQSGAPLPIIPAICHAISLSTGRDERDADRWTGACTTVQKFVGREPIAGIDQLYLSWPSVAKIFATWDPAENGQVHIPTAEYAALELVDAIRSAPDGVSVIAAACGVGKTRAAIAVAVERAKSEKRPLKTSISVPTNALAKQVFSNLREAGVSCARIYSPASELDPDGVPYCKYAKSAKHLAHGFMSVPKDFCQGRGHDPCQYLQTCPAASGLEGNDTATVTVGNHGLLSVLVRSAGKTGLRIIDEPQTLLTTHSITGIDLAAAQQLAYSFDLELGEIMRECLRLLQMIVVDNTDMNATEIEHVIGKKLVDRAIAVQTEHQFVAPPVPWTLVRQAREQPVTAARLSTASRCVWIIWRAIITDAKWLLRRENRGRTPTLLLTGPDEQFVGALLSEGATVVIDASPDVEVLSRACGYNVGGSRLSTVTARDGAPIERTLIQWSRGNRTALLPSGTPAIPLFLIGLRKVVDWCLEDPTCRTIGLITLMPFHALYDTDEAFRTQVAEVTKPWNGQILWGHFGAIRGLDDWKHCDALVTLGDPWSNVGDVANDAAFLELKDPENRAEWLAARELEQAHGRLRAPHRTVSGRALHVGRVAPLGWSTVEVDVRLSVNGRPKNRSAVTPSDLRDWIKTTCGGSVSAAARELMCGKSTLHRYLCGEINVPAAIAAYIR